MGNNESSHNFIENVMPDGVKFEDLPEIKHYQHFVGPTDYLDNIYPKNLTHYVMRGKDHFQRLYIVVYYKNNIQTYFQRYTDSPNGIWSYGTYMGGNKDDLILKNSGNIALQNDSMKKIKKIIKELLENNKIIPIEHQKNKKIQIP